MGEIESVLASEASIEQAVVVAREDRPGAKSLIAYVRLAAGATIDEAALRNAVTATLPDYMVPSRVVALDAFPLTPNGKIDRRALPEPSSVIVASRRSSSLTSPTEQRVEEIWCQALGLESFDLDANFFELGGDSVALSVCISKLERAIGHRVSPASFSRGPFASSQRS